MNKEKIVNSMISYIEEAERALQASKISSEPKAAKIDIVNNIIEKLEKEVDDEN